ncbi:MAG: class I SAM-dependent methyltransferase [Planctomycetales bacterium]
MSSSESHEVELDRVRTVFADRRRDVDPDFYAFHHPANLFLRHGQERAIVWALNRLGMTPLRDKAVLDVGCGEGNWIAAFDFLGAPRERAAGVDLMEERVECCRRRFPQADVRVADAAKLPWDDESFDLVSQFTVFTSVLDDDLKQAIAAEMLRVLRPGGAIAWGDFLYNNPRNPNVRGIGMREIKRLFPGCVPCLRKVTLAPPLARRIVPVSWTLAAWLESLGIFNTHYFGLIHKPQ